MKYYYILSRMAKIKKAKFKNASAGKNVEQLRLSYIASRNGS